MENEKSYTALEMATLEAAGAWAAKQAAKQAAKVAEMRKAADVVHEAEMAYREAAKTVREAWAAYKVVAEREAEEAETEPQN